MLRAERSLFLDVLNAGGEKLQEALDSLKSAAYHQAQMEPFPWPMLWWHEDLGEELDVVHFWAALWGWPNCSEEDVRFF